eukprot:GHVR01094735.1.p1 GENE.GHVR01094735.1~~GHVR01094735.1.p1  ORF type:complete len:195 (-),score=10.92 GHVR01094735.1:62-604(-)
MILYIQLLEWWDSRVSALNPSIEADCEWLRHAFEAQAQGHEVPEVPVNLLRGEPGQPSPASFHYEPNDSPTVKHSFRRHCTNSFQRHTKCSTNTCLKMKKGKLICKAKFPKDLQNKSWLKRIVNHTYEETCHSLASDPMHSRIVMIQATKSRVVNTSGNPNLVEHMGRVWVSISIQHYYV